MFGFVKRYGLFEFCEQRWALIFFFLGNRLRRRIILHVQLGVKLYEPRALFSELGLLWKWLFKLGAGVLRLALQVLKPGAAFFKLLVHASERVLHSHDVA